MIGYKLQLLITLLKILLTNHPPTPSVKGFVAVSCFHAASPYTFASEKGLSLSA